MTPEQLRFRGQVNAWIKKALRVATDERSEFLAKHVEDPKVRAAVERKIRSNALPSSKLESLQDLTMDFELLDDEPRSGGMGKVFRARQSNLGRTVALKVLHGSWATVAESDVLTRFGIETQAAAQLDHPNIVPIFQVGTFRERPAIAMRYVDGPSLDRLTDKGPIDQRRAAGYLTAVCGAVHHAHQHGILHRDLKPSNILIDESTDDPLVVDFGIAKFLHAERGPTIDGDVVGTPNYMSPEQARGGSSDVGPTADVYSLGATLYELLTGRPPFTASTPLETQHQVLNNEVPRVRSINPEIVVDLETICLKCLEKDPGTRFASASAMADDLRRYLEGRPILARRVSWRGRLRRWCCRNPAVATLLATAMLLVIIIVASSVNASIEQRALREAADAQRTIAVENGQKAEQRAVDLAKQLRLTQLSVYNGQIRRADEVWRSDPEAAMTMLQDKIRCLPKLRDFAWSCLHASCGSRDVTLTGHQGSIVGIQFSPDGRTLASAGEDGFIRIWSVATSKIQRELVRWSDPEPAMAFSSTGRQFGWVARKGLVRVIDLGTGETKDIDTGFAVVESIALSRAGNALATVARNGPMQESPGGAISERAIQLWHAKGKRSNPRFLSKRRDTKIHIRFDRDRDNLLVSGHTGMEKWDTATLKLLYQVSGKDLNHSFVFNDLGSHGAALGVDSDEISIFSIENQNRPAQTLTVNSSGAAGTFSDRFTSIAISPDGQRVAGILEDDVILLWSVTDGGRIAEVYNAIGAQFSGDSRLLAVRGGGSSVRIYDTQTGARKMVLESGVSEVPNTLTFSSDGRRLALATPSGQIRLLGVGAESGRESEAISSVGIDRVDFGSNGTVVIALSDGKLTAVDTKSGKILTDCPGYDEGHGGEFVAAPDGDVVAYPTEKHRIKVMWNLGGNRTTWVLDGHEGEVRCLACSDDGSVLVSGGWDKKVRLWDLTQQSERLVLTGHSACVTAVAVSPKSNFVISGDHEGDVRQWDMKNGKTLARFLGSSDSVSQLAVSEQEDLVAVACQDGTVRVWEVETGLLVGLLECALRPRIEFSPDGNLLAINGIGGIVKLWSTSTRKIASILQAHMGKVTAIDFSPDGRSLVTAGRDGSVKLWCPVTGQLKTVLTGSEPSGGCSCARFSADGSTLVAAFTRLVANPEGVAFLKFWDGIESSSWDKPLGLASGNEGGTEERESNRAPLIERVGPRAVAANSKLIVPVRAYDPDDGQQLRFSLNAPVLSMGASIDGVSGVVTWSPPMEYEGTRQTFVVRVSDNGMPQRASEERFYVYVRSTPGIVTRFGTGIGSNNQVAISPEGRYAATVSGGSRNDRTVRLWWVAEGRHEQLASRCGGDVAFRNSSQIVVAVAKRKNLEVFLWDIEKRRALNHWDTGFDRPIGAPWLADNGEFVAYQLDEKRIVVRDTRQFKEVIATGASKLGGMHRAVSNDGKVVATSFGTRTVRKDGPELCIWNLSNASHSIVSVRGSVHSMAISPDSKVVAVGDDKGISLWNPLGEQLGQFEVERGPVSGIAFSADGKSLVAGGGFRTSIWDRETGTKTADVSDVYSDPVTSMAVSTDGRFAVMGKSSGYARVWAISPRQSTSATSKK